MNIKASKVRKLPYQTFLTGVRFYRMFRSRSSKKLSAQRSRVLRERANLSFVIVIMFFAVFGVIVLTEIFLIDERGRGAGVLVRHGGRRRGVDKPDYEDAQSILQVSLVCIQGRIKVFGAPRQ
jgi:hypothetical protein